MYAPAARKIQGGKVRRGNTQNTERNKESGAGKKRQLPLLAFAPPPPPPHPSPQTDTHILKRGEEKEERVTFISTVHKLCHLRK